MAREESWMLYGANGYSGELAAAEAVRRGLRPTLAARRADAVRAIAERLDDRCGERLQTSDVVRQAPLDEQRRVRVDSHAERAACVGDGAQPSSEARAPPRGVREVLAHSPAAASAYKSRGLEPG